MKSTIIFALVLLVASTFVANAGSEKSHTKSVDEWHKGRVERLMRPTGWLSLVGFFPIEEGTHTFGSSSDNTMVFPAGTPAHAGVLERNGNVIRLIAKDGVMHINEGQVWDVQLLPDTHENFTAVNMDRMQFYVAERVGQFYLRVKDRESSVRKEFTHIDRYPVASKWCVTAKFQPYDPPKMITIDNVMGYKKRLECPGVAVFTVDGKEYRLEPTIEGDQFFFAFADDTSGDETYGGGRYIYTDQANENGEVVIDFNLVYNPPCVFTPYASCPLPRRENILSVRVDAGEKLYRAAH